ncbi:MAG: right-handed parallel beta-helix repeat-containing protein [Trueperaceae bacterium]|nr:MAG: right-handed parallel beta-helix repeat-containing protein [Trueperaceae bacterium]
MDEPQTAAFIDTHFRLQDRYAQVFCVSGDDSCPATVTTRVPCLTATCAGSDRTYEVSEVFETLQAAADRASPGTLILITPGRYRGVEIEATGGEDGAYIHFLGWGPPGSVVIDAPADPTKSYLRHHFYFIDVHHYIVQNLAFEGADEGAGLFFSGYFNGTGQFSDHIVVLDVYSHDNGDWGLMTTSTNYMLIQDSVFTNSAFEHGMYISGSSDNVVIRRNVFQGNAASGLQVNADPQTATWELFYWLQNATGDTCQWVEEDVEFTGRARWRDIKACYDAQGLPDLGEFIEDGISENFIIEQNVMNANGEVGAAAINLASLRHSAVRNNLMYNNFAAGIACWDNAYAEEKRLDASVFGCEDVSITNNTIVDESGNRGALILNNDARSMRVFNNIVVRDRFDAYEIANRSGEDLLSGANYLFARSVDNSPGASDEIDSITGFGIAEALDQFVTAGFSPWVLEDGSWPELNPNRPDYRPRAESVLVGRAEATYLPTFDLDTRLRSDRVIGALGAAEIGAVSAVEAVTGTAAAAVAEPVSAAVTTSQEAPVRGSITYTLPDGHIYLHPAYAGAEPLDVSAALDALSPGLDGWVNLSPDGQWLLLESERFDAECEGWPCLVVSDVALASPEVVAIEGDVLHAGQSAAVASGGRLIVFQASDGPHETDLFATVLERAGWSSPVLLTAESPYAWNDGPALSADGLHVLFDCGDEPYGAEGTAICEVGTDGEGLRVVLTPSQGPAGFPRSGALHHADYAPDGSIVFEADWDGEQIWRLPQGSTVPERLSTAFNNDNSPCVLPDGRIVSLWLDRPGGQGFHEIKVMSRDGAQETMLLIDVDVQDVGLGCGESVR